MSLFLKRSQSAEAPACRRATRTPAGDRPGRVQRVVSGMFALLVAVLVFGVVGEGATRIYHWLWWDLSIVSGHPRKESSPRISPIAIDEKLGWRATENYQFVGTKRSSDGTPYAVKVSHDSRGFRAFGDLSSARPKVFIIGDSFTVPFWEG